MDNLKKFLIIFVLALTGWALCGAIIGIGFAVTTVQNTLIIHLVGAPIIFTAISLIYFKRFDFTTPLQTALIFVSFAILMDFFVVALLIEKSFEMFTSVIGTWLPWAFIFLSTYFVGVSLKKQTRETMIA